MLSKDDRSKQVDRYREMERERKATMSLDAVPGVSMKYPPVRARYTYDPSTGMINVPNDPVTAGLKLPFPSTQMERMMLGINDTRQRGFPSHPSEDEEYDRLDEEDQKKMLRGLQDVE